MIETTDAPPSLTPAQYPIGVFDSGMGGLSVMQDIRALLPNESLIYAADAGSVPYGGRSASLIRDRSRALVQFLAATPVKAVVVACNTATAAAVPDLRRHWPSLPIIAMEPAVKPAVAATRSGVVGVLATEGTLGSDRFSGLVSQYAGSVRVLTRPCPGLVERVEQGDLDSPELDRLLAGYLQPLLEAGADTIILGCTHYPFLRERILLLAGRPLHLIDTGAAVARELRRRLGASALLSPASAPAATAFWTTGDVAALERFLARHWQETPVRVRAIGNIEKTTQET